MVVREYYDTKLAINEIYLLNFLNICTRMLKLYIFNKLCFVDYHIAVRIPHQTPRPPHIFTSILYNATLPTSSLTIFSKLLAKLHSPKSRLNVE